MALAGVVRLSAQFCSPHELEGAYAFAISGTSTIAGDTEPVAELGRLEFDGAGTVSGTASVNFAGYYFGNPVTGSYQAHADCSLTWSLQDDSGAFQHFAGVLTPDLQRATFRQTDRGGRRGGTLMKVAPECSSSALQGSYEFSISGSTIPMNPGETAHPVSLAGILTINADGDVAIVHGNEASPAGTATADSDCIVQMLLTPSSGEEMDFRGVLAGGREILAIETDPGTAVNARFRALHQRNFTSTAAPS